MCDFEIYLFPFCGFDYREFLFGEYLYGSLSVIYYFHSVTSSNFSLVCERLSLCPEAGTTCRIKTDYCAATANKYKPNRTGLNNILVLILFLSMGRESSCLTLSSTTQAIGYNSNPTLCISCEYEGVLTYL